MAACVAIDSVSSHNHSERRQDTLLEAALHICPPAHHTRLHTAHETLFSSAFTQLLDLQL